MEQVEMSEERMSALGLKFPVFSGIQIDLNVAMRYMPDGSKRSASLCDHNCTSEVGGYDCSSAFTRNKGIKVGFASGQKILEWIEVGRAGLAMARDRFMETHFSDYCRLFRIPDNIRMILGESMRSGLCEVNLFGGNPEMHKKVLWLVKGLREKGFRVNLTTTGRRFLTDKQFIREFEENPPHLLALSADDFDPDKLDELFNMSLTDLKLVWKAINPLHGQAQKFVEGIYAARLVQEMGIQTTVLFNMVLHRGNLNHVGRILECISRYLPKALVNPYPAQDSFEGGSGDLFYQNDIAQFSNLTEFFIGETKRGNPNLTKRIQYWLVMAAIAENYKDHPSTASRFIAGHNIWKCYQREPIPGAGMYLQIGKSNPNLVQIGNGPVQPGGYAGCYWQSTTVTSPVQVSSPEGVAEHLMGGMQKLAALAHEPCKGCSMPRLWFNMMTTELGLNPILRPYYFELRKHHVGF